MAGTRKNRWNAFANKNLKAKKKKKWEWKDEHYREVLQEMGAEVSDDFVGHEFEGAILFIKPGLRDGRHVMLTNAICYWKNGKPLIRGIKDVLEKDEDWEAWDIFETEQLCEAAVRAGRLRTPKTRR
jgi:hypothetical protein